MSPAGATPLDGKRVLVTRASEQARALIDALEAAGAAVVHVPAIRFAPPPDRDALDRLIDSPGKWDWVVFTSSNGVRFFEQRAHEKGTEASRAIDAKIAAVGSATADALRAIGIEPDVVPDKSLGIEILGLLPDDQRGVRTAVVRALEGREELIEELRAKGGEVHVAVAYETRGLERLPDELRRMLLDGEIDVLTFTSPSTAENILRHLSPEELRRTTLGSRFVSIGPTTTEALRGLGVEDVQEAEAASVQGLVQAVIAAIR